MRKGILPSILLFILWASLITWVNPTGNFPLNDDWRYAWPVHSYLNSGQFTLSAGYAPNVLIHQVHAILLSKTGVYPDFTWLRGLALLLSFLTIIVVERILHLTQAGKKKKYTLLALLLFNPVYFSISFSYMTDIPFLFYACCSIWAYLLFLKKGKNTYRILGFATALLAFLVRQPGILIPIAFEGALLLHSRSKQQLWQFSLYFLVLLVAYLSLQFILKPQLGIDKGPQAEQQYFDYLIKQPHVFGFRLLKYNLMATYYFGLFLLPFWGYLVKWAYPKLGSKGFVVLLFFQLAIATILAMQGRFFPFGGNYLHAAGVGPLLLSDIRHFGANPLPVLPKWLLFTLGVICQVNGVLLVWKGASGIHSRLQSGRFPRSLVFLSVLLALYLPAMTIFSFFDRYLLLPLVLVLVLWAMSSWKPAASAFIYIFVIAWISTAGTHDYLQWNRAAHQFYNSLVSTGVPVEQIDGGVALNGYHLGETHNPDPRYRLSFSTLPGHEVVEEKVFRSWLSGRTLSVFLLNTNPPPPTPPQTSPSAPTK